ncbi:hypothetical protein COF61_26660 [Bacillus toyonensis]|nr:hypothetical protein COF61_26660 [Bacillus toyonensis]
MCKKRDGYTGEERLARIKQNRYFIKNEKEHIYIVLLEKKSRFLCLEGLHTITYACPVKR